MSSVKSTGPDLVDLDRRSRPVSKRNTPCGFQKF
jgi:hypothetical protein